MVIYFICMFYCEHWLVFQQPSETGCFKCIRCITNQFFIFDTRRNLFKKIVNLISYCYCNKSERYPSCRLLSQNENKLNMAFLKRVVYLYNYLKYACHVTKIVCFATCKHVHLCRIMLNCIICLNCFKINVCYMQCCINTCLIFKQNVLHRYVHSHMNLIDKLHKYVAINDCIQRLRIVHSLWQTNTWKCLWNIMT